MTGIMWLASYPKSGNTWLRVFLANLLTGASRPFDINALAHFSHGDMAGGLYERIAGRALEEMTNEELHRLRPQVHCLIAEMRPETMFVKTHSAVVTLAGIPTITPEVTAGAIYVVRNPLDVAVSYARHLELTTDQAIAAMSAHKNRMPSGNRLVFQFLGSWSDHVASWTTTTGLKLHVVRYEDMLSKPIKAFGKVSAFLGLKPPRERLKRAVRFSSFRELQAQEQRQGFRERSRRAERFFREGRAEQWREVLTPAQVESMVAAHAEQMERFDYLP